MDLLEVTHRDAVHAVRSFIRKHLASELKDFIRMVKENRSSGPYVFDHPNMAWRATLPLIRFTVTPMCYVIILDLVFLYEEYYFLLAVYLRSLENPEVCTDYIVCLIPYKLRPPFGTDTMMKATAVEVQSLLVSGRNKEALDCAQEGQLWGPALVLAAQLGNQVIEGTSNASLNQGSTADAMHNGIGLHALPVSTANASIPEMIIQT